MGFHAQDMFPQCMALGEFGEKFVSQFEDTMGIVYYNSGIENEDPENEDPKTYN